MKVARMTLATCSWDGVVPESETNAKHKPDSELSKEDGFGSIVIAWHFWLSNVIFALIMWWWLTGRPDSL